MSVKCEKCICIQLPGRDWKAEDGKGDFKIEIAGICDNGPGTIKSWRKPSRLYEKYGFVEYTPAHLSESCDCHEERFIK
jgi:hypothetical protein